MMLITVDAFRRRYFDEDSAPSANTVRRWIASGKLPGRQIGDLWYVDEHTWQSGGDELVNKVLQG
jgi:hypothetical protein